jgi:hypothetical protein
MQSEAIEAMAKHSSINDEARIAQTQEGAQFRQSEGHKPSQKAES